MTTSRREKLEGMLADDPEDQMLRYMLALELDKDGENERSLQLLAGLMADSLPHVPSFLMAGQQQARLGLKSQAIETFESGIRQARTQHDDHAAAEMTQFLAELRATP